MSEVSCERRVLERALRDLEEAAGRDGRIAAAGAALRDRLHELADRVRPRTEYGLIHGELGPDHVLVDTDGHPILIDIEGLMYFDVEWEHVFLRLRFGEQYTALAGPGLDPQRLDLYVLAMRLSLVAGPLRLLDGDFPDRAFMQGIAEHNAKEALALLPLMSPWDGPGRAEHSSTPRHDQLERVGGEVDAGGGELCGHRRTQEKLDEQRIDPVVEKMGDVRAAQ